MRTYIQDGETFRSVSVFDQGYQVGDKIIFTTTPDVLDGTEETLTVTSVLRADVLPALDMNRCVLSFQTEQETTVPPVPDHTLSATINSSKGVRVKIECHHDLLPCSAANGINHTDVWGLYWEGPLTEDVAVADGMAVVLTYNEEVGFWQWAGVSATQGGIA